MDKQDVGILIGNHRMEIADSYFAALKKGGEAETMKENFIDELMFSGFSYWDADRISDVYYGY